MKRFYLLRLFPVGTGSGNEVLAECSRYTESDAIKTFQKRFPKLPLDDNGYAKAGVTSYCVALAYSH